MPQRFTSERKIGQGGNGLIRAGKDLELSRGVVIKELKPGKSNPESLSRLMREARIQAGLQHPSVVPVFGLGKWGDGRPYYAMQQVDGVTLEQAVRDLADSVRSRDTKSLSTCPCVASLRSLIGRYQDICLAIEYAHQQRVIHRDISPKNIMLGYFGESFIIDWGLAKRLDQHTCDEHSQDDPAFRSGGTQLGDLLATIDVKTETGWIGGTPAYMSPEQMSGKPTDHLSDIYGLGATLYFLLTGVAPFDLHQISQSKFSFEQHLSTLKNRICDKRGFRLPTQVNRRVSTQLEAICLRAMESDPQKRYSTAGEMASDLGRWLDNRPVAARRERMCEFVSRMLANHYGVVIGIVLCVCAFSFLGYQETQHRQRREELKLTAATISKMTQLAISGYAHSPTPQTAAMLNAARDSLQELLDLRRPDLDSLDHATQRSVAMAAYLRGRIDDHLPTGSGTARLQSSKQLLQEIYHRYPSESNLRMLGETSHCLAIAYKREGRLAKSLAEFQYSLILRRQLINRDPRNLLYKADLARGYGYLGDAQMSQLDVAGALESYLRSINERKVIVKNLEESNAGEGLAVPNLQLSRANANLARVFRGAVGEFFRSQKLFVNSMHIAPRDRGPASDAELLQADLVAGDFPAQRAQIEYEKGLAYFAERQYKLAATDFGDALAQSRKLSHSHPAVPRFQTGPARHLIWIALAQFRMRQSGFHEALDDATVEFRKLVESRNSLLQNDPWIRSDWALCEAMRVVVRIRQSSEEVSRLGNASRLMAEALEQEPNDWLLQWKSNLLHQLILGAIEDPQAVTTSNSRSTQFQEIRSLAERNVEQTKLAMEKIRIAINKAIEERKEELQFAEMRSLGDSE